MTEKEIDLDIYLKFSNIENIYSSFNKIFLSKINEENNEKEEKINKMINSKSIVKNNISLNSEILNINNKLQYGNYLENFRNQEQINSDNLQNNQTENNDEKNNDQNNIIMQWRFLLELLIIFIKDDSSPYWNLISFYEETISSQTKREFFNNIKKNEEAMKDLENILKEKIIIEILAKENLTDLNKLKNNIDNFLLILFEEKKVDKIIDELTINKVSGDTKLFYLKDSSFNYLDMNYYISPQDKSTAQRYILEFKKDVVNLYNNYYFNPSNLTFDFFSITYEKLLLSRNNLEFIIKIVERLLKYKKIEIGEFNIKSVKNTILPIILNYLSIFSMINTKSFIEFKIRNRDFINKLSKILIYYTESNKRKDILEVDLQKNIKEIIKQLNNFEIIYADIKYDLSQLNNYDYNTNYIKQLNKGFNSTSIENSLTSIIKNDSNEQYQKKENLKKMKEKLKKKMKLKSDGFFEKVKINKVIKEEINNENKNLEKENQSKDEIMCFYCRNQIKLNSFEVSYGKTGLLINDYFYRNSQKSIIRKEIPKILKNKNYSKD